MRQRVVNVEKEKRKALSRGDLLKRAYALYRDRMLINAATPLEVRSALQAMGYTLQVGDRTSGPINAILLTPSTAQCGVGRVITGRITGWRGRVAGGPG